MVPAIRPEGFGFASEHVGHYLRDIVYGASDGVVTTLVAFVVLGGLPLFAYVLALLVFAHLVEAGTQLAALAVLIWALF